KSTIIVLLLGAAKAFADPSSNEPPTITVAKDGTLQWQVGEGTLAYITDVGAVRGPGKLKVTPATTTTYVIFSEGSETPASATLAVGYHTRGDDFPLNEEFSGSLSYATDESVVSALSKAHKT